MSRIGKQPIEVPAGTKVEIRDGVFWAEGPKGKVSQFLLDDCPVSIDGATITIERKGDSGPMRARHGLIRSLINNAVVGVTQGFSKTLEIVGVGYRAEVKGRQIDFALGYSHPIVYKLPEGVDAVMEARSSKIDISGADKQKVGQVAAEIRSLRPPDPYKAKGIRYVDEEIRRKVGKAGAAA